MSAWTAGTATNGAARGDCGSLSKQMLVRAVVRRSPATTTHSHAHSEGHCSPPMGLADAQFGSRAPAGSLQQQYQAVVPHGRSSHTQAPPSVHPTWREEHRTSARIPQERSRFNIRGLYRKPASAAELLYLPISRPYASTSAWVIGSLHAFQVECAQTSTESPTLMMAPSSRLMPAYSRSTGRGSTQSGLTECDRPLGWITESSDTTRPPA